MGFEPTLPKKTELESVALDHSATDAFYIYLYYKKNVLVFVTSLTGLEPAIFPLGEGCVTITLQRLMLLYFWFVRKNKFWKYRVSIPVPRVCGTRALPIELYPQKRVSIVLPPPGIEPGTFRSSVWRSPSWAIAAYIYIYKKGKNTFDLNRIRTCNNVYYQICHYFEQSLLKLVHV